MGNKVLTSNSYSIKINILWLTFLLPLLFVSDIIYGGLVYYNIELTITPGVILRGLVLLISIYMLLKYSRLAGKCLLIWLLLIVFSVLPSIFVGIIHTSSLFFDISALSKVIYFPFTTALFVILLIRYRIEHDEVLRYIEYAAYVLGVALLVSQEVGIQRETYGDYAFGSTGIFYAQNDLTLAFGLSLLSAAYRVVLVRFSMARLFLLMLSVFALLQIGTRASLAVVTGIVLTLLLLMVRGYSKKVLRGKGNLWIKWFLSITIAIGLFSLLIYGVGKQQEHDFQQQKLEEIAEGISPRQPLIIAGALYIEERSLLFDFTGEGMDIFQRGVARYFTTDVERRFVEVDWLDIFGAYGIFFAIVIHLFVLSVLAGSSRRFLGRTREPVDGLIAAVTFLYLSHSIFAGHALTSPIPSTLMAAYFSIYFSKVMVGKKVLKRKVTVIDV